MSDFWSATTNFLSYAVLIIEAMVILLIICAIVLICALYIRDRTQAKHTILRNYPVIGRLRYYFEHLGGFFRQYFFAADREELPFNRASRSWVYRAAKNVDTTRPFGSTKSITDPGTLLFSNAPFPTLAVDSVPAENLVIGQKCKFPYTTTSFFNISAMSFGALSRPAVEALSLGAKLGNCWLNTGEGGISPHHLLGKCDLVAQIGTAKYGYRTTDGKFDFDKIIAAAELPAVKMFEIKLSQGAKPGKGGLLPGEKVTAEIAQIRGIPAGKDSISPNRFVEINSIPELLELMDHIRKITGKPVGCKMVLGNKEWFNEFCHTIKQDISLAPDFITLDSADGGTGAAPMALLDHVGMPLRSSLPLVINLLQQHQLIEHIKVIASGKLITPAQVAWALCTGADFVVTARGFMFALGCIQALQCNKNTCPTGVTTHNPRLQRGLVPTNKAQRVANYVKNMRKEVGQIAHACGVTSPRLLARNHCMIVQQNGNLATLDELYKL